MTAVAGSGGRAGSPLGSGGWFAFGTFALTSLAMIAFAANSIICRLALGAGTIDAAGFAAVRLTSGALTLAAIVAATRRRAVPLTGRAWSAALLFGYAVPFSFAYVTLTAGTGALILFGAVQLTMIGVALGRGERLGVRQWAGLGAAVTGFIALVLPGLTSPPLVGSALMAVAGVSWGLYSLVGRGAADPLVETAGAFVLSVPLALLTVIVAARGVHLTGEGILLATCSGAVTSGIGYAIWYAALRGLSRSGAATVQLSVPVIAALGGVLLLGEAVSLRLAAATVLILGGVVVVLSAEPTRTAGRGAGALDAALATRTGPSS